MKTLQLSLPLLAALLGACATTGTEAPATDAARDCRQLEAERSELRAAQREAQEKKGSAWKAVVPFAVAGRVVSANSTLRETEQRLAALGDEARRLGCSSSI